MARLNTGYLQSNRGVIKIIQIIVGCIMAGMLCGTHWGGGCMGDGRIGFTSSLNFVYLIINIIWFIINLLELLSLYRIERICALVGTVLFLIATGLMIWMLIWLNHTYGMLIVATVLAGVLFFCHLWDVKILQGEASNW